MTVSKSTRQGPCCLGTGPDQGYQGGAGRDCECSDDVLVPDCYHDDTQNQYISGLGALFCSAVASQGDGTTDCQVEPSCTSPFEAEYVGYALFISAATHGSHLGKSEATLISSMLRHAELEDDIDGKPMCCLMASAEISTRSWRHSVDRANLLTSTI